MVDKFIPYADRIILAALSLTQQLFVDLKKRKDQ